MNSTRRPPSRWGIVPRTLVFAGAIVLGLGLFFGVLAGALAWRAHLQRQADANWKPPAEDAADVARRNAMALGTPAAALAPETRPTTVETREPQPIALWAQQAALSGRGLTLTGKRDLVIGEWRSAEAAATWPLDPAAGEYHVDLTYAVRAEEGGDFTVTVAGQTLKGRAAPTGAARGRKSSSTSFATVRVGTIKLPDGPTRLEVRPAGLPKNALMSLLRVDLIPPGAPGSNTAVAMATFLDDDDDAAESDEERKMTPEQKAERRARLKREAERVASTPAEDIAKWKRIAAERAEFDRAQREAKLAQMRKDEQERKDRRELARKEEERRREAKAQAKRDMARPPEPVEAFLLVDARSGQVLDTLRDGARINLAALPRERLSVVARVGDDTRADSVRFALDGNDKFHTEEEPPYVLTGGDAEGGKFARPLAITPGKHTLAATSFAGPGATGAAGKTLEITFTAVDEPGKPRSGGVVTALTLIDCDRNGPLTAVTDGAKLDWGALSGKKLTILAETAGDVGSVRFELQRSDGHKFQHVENNAPYALMSDHADRFIPYDGLKPGKYKLSAMPFAEDEARGGDGKSLAIKFEIVDGK